jgi:hypothetical protein
MLCRPGAPESAGASRRRAIAFLAARNENPRRYVWKAKGEDILRKINAARAALAVAQSGFSSLLGARHGACFMVGGVRPAGCSG